MTMAKRRFLVEVDRAQAGEVVRSSIEMRAIDTERLRAQFEAAGLSVNLSDAILSIPCMEFLAEAGYDGVVRSWREVLD